jgi:coenzyme F420-0:L-glutamate ligase / coenzyme F420-1:gamma-L-glutamate ligase
MDASPTNSGKKTATQTGGQLSISALSGIPLVNPGDDLTNIIGDGLLGCGITLQDGDILVLAQKIVSKSEGRYVPLDSVKPSPAAIELAEEVDKDPRLVELILSESKEVIRKRKGVLIVEHNLGIVMANAGIDASNVEPLENDTERDAKQQVLLLPKDPDRSCNILRGRIREKTGADVAIVINDSVGRAWRNGTVGMAIGTAGIDALLDLNGRPDLFDRPLQATQVGLADELASAASIVMGQADEGRPAVHIRGYDVRTGQGNAQDLIRAQEQDLFR